MVVSPAAEGSLLQALQFTVIEAAFERFGCARHADTADWVFGEYEPPFQVGDLGGIADQGEIVLAGSHAAFKAPVAERGEGCVCARMPCAFSFRSL